MESDHHQYRPATIDGVTRGDTRDRFTTILLSNNTIIIIIIIIVPFE